MWTVMNFRLHGRATPQCRPYPSWEAPELLSSPHSSPQPCRCVWLPRPWPTISAMSGRPSRWRESSSTLAAQVYAPDVIWQNPFGVRLHSEAALERFLTGLFKRPGYLAGTSTSTPVFKDVTLLDATSATNEPVLKAQSLPVAGGSGLAYQDPPSRTLAEGPQEALQALRELDEGHRRLSPSGVPDGG